MQLSSAYLPYSLRKRSRPKLVRKCLPAVTKRRRGGGNFSKGGSVFLVGRTGQWLCSELGFSLSNGPALGNYRLDRDC